MPEGRYETAYEAAITEKLRAPNKSYANLGAAPYKATVLEEAKQLITADRNIAYGDAAVNMKNAAEMVTSYLAQRLRSGKGITAHDMAIIMVISKISRIACGEFKRDNYVDAAGYLAIAAEIGYTEQTQEKCNATGTEQQATSALGSAQSASATNPAGYSPYKS